MCYQPVDVAVHIGLPVTHVDDHIPGQTRLAGGGMGGASCALVVDVADLGVGVVTLRSGTGEVRGCGGRLGDMEVGVPVWTSNAQQVLKGRGSRKRIDGELPI